MSLVDVIADFGEDRTVTRYSSPSPRYDSHGYVIADSSSSLTLTIAVFPLTYRDLKVVPEGRRIEDTRYAYCEDKLFGQDTTNSPDVIDVHGEDFVVASVKYWPAVDGAFYQAVCARRPVGGGP